MVIPVQVTTRRTELSDETRQLIEDSAARLDRFYDRITACRVVVEVPAQYPAGEPCCHQVRIDLTVPGGELAIRKVSRPQVNAAVRDAFEALGRRLQDFARRQRGDVKRRAAPEPA